MQGFAHLLHATEVAVVAVAVFTDGDVEFDLVVGIIPLHLAQIPLDPAPSHHHPAESVAARIVRGDDAHAHGALFPDAVGADDLLDLVDAGAELGGPHEDVVEEAVGEVEGDAAGADVGGVEAGAGDALVELHELFALLEAPKEGREGADVHGVGEDSHQVWVACQYY